MKLTSPKSLLVHAPDSVTAIERRSRIELIQAVCLVRFLALFLLMVVLSSRGLGGLALIHGVTALAGAAYLISRTRWYRWAAVLVVVDPILGVPHFVGSNSDSLYVLISAPIWLAPGPFVSALVFRPAVTAGFVAATAGSFFSLAYQVDPAFWPAIGSQFLAVSCTATLALIGNVIRVRDERVLREERAKVLQSAKLASVGEMAAGVAHELNSPLGAVLLNLEVLRERVRTGQANPPAMEARIEAALRVVDRMAKIIAGLRTFARDAHDEDFVPVPVGDWIDDTLNLCQRRFRDHGIDMRIDRTGFAAVARVQRIQVSQALLNLLNNCFDAVGTRDERWVDLSARVVGDVIKVVVTDSGPGIAPEVAAKMFHPFFTTKDFGAGPGLGLSISRGILQEQAGDLIYEPAPRTTFVMRLPHAK